MGDKEPSGSMCGERSGEVGNCELCVLLRWNKIGAYLETGFRSPWLRWPRRKRSGWWLRFKVQGGDGTLGSLRSCNCLCLSDKDRDVKLSKPFCELAISTVSKNHCSLCAPRFPVPKWRSSVWRCLAKPIAAKRIRPRKILPPLSSCQTYF